MCNTFICLRSLVHLYVTESSSCASDAILIFIKQHFTCGMLLLSTSKVNVQQKLYDNKFNSSYF